ARGVLLPIIKRADKVRLMSVATATGLSARNTGAQFGFANATTDYSEIIDDADSSAVFIATRHDSHASLAAGALRRGKAVFVEKPLATTEEGLREVVRAALETGGLLMVGFNRRFAPLAQQVKAKFASRNAPMTIIYRVNAGQVPPEHWTHDPDEGGGRIIGEACHFVDFVSFLTDALPAKVSAAAVPRTQRAGYVDDSTVVSMAMTDGSVASIIYTASGDPTVPKEQVEIFCERGVATIDDFKSGAFVAGRKRTKLGGGAQDKGHAAEIAAFFEAARGRAAAPISLESLAATTLATFAIVESTKSGAGCAVDVNTVMA
ncbi:MAG TPA: Gfo/Idh/MocA family oxidoreductase, partial [Blastocatellia bacterium]|nr:Gfo/Idh/MocA family oxidoreductase [Blastocatellia bacterium]